MKILVCGAPPDKVEAIIAAAPDDDVRVITHKHTDRWWQQRLVHADLCIIIPKYMGHKQMFMVRKMYGRNYVNASSVGAVIDIVQQYTKGGPSWIAMWQ